MHQVAALTDVGTDVVEVLIGVAKGAAVVSGSRVQDASTAVAFGVSASSFEM